MITADRLSELQDHVLNNEASKELKDSLTEEELRTMIIMTDELDAMIYEQVAELRDIFKQHM